MLKTNKDETTIWVESRCAQQRIFKTAVKERQIQLFDNFMIESPRYRILLDVGNIFR